MRKQRSWKTECKEEETFKAIEDKLFIFIACTIICRQKLHTRRLYVWGRKLHSQIKEGRRLEFHSSEHKIFSLEWGTKTCSGHKRILLRLLFTKRDEKNCNKKKVLRAQKLQFCAIKIGTETPCRVINRSCPTSTYNYNIFTITGDFLRGIFDVTLHCSWLFFITFLRLFKCFSS